MISLLVYLTGTVILAGLVSVLSTVFRPVKGRVDVKGGRAIFFWFLLIMAGPFVYVESLTKSHSPELEKAIREGFSDSPIDGDLLYYKIVRFQDKSATAYVIGQETEGVGFSDRPVLKLDLEFKGKHWEVADSKMLYSTRLNQDELIFPPYR